jgi:hypothetical protein
MSGKKKSKSRISVGVCANADGSDKLSLLFIGKSKQPRCFKKMTARSRRKLQYYSNKKAWMKKDIFEE